MSKEKVYQVSDLFFTEWEQLTAKNHCEVFALQQMAESIDKSKIEYGLTIIQLLKRLIKRPRLVDKVNYAQAVDIYNDLKFLREPWHYFPPIEQRALPLVTPEAHLARHSFDHFIYADNEFSSFIVTQDPKYLTRLIVTLYPLPGEEFFDKESVDARASLVEPKLKEWQKNLVLYTFGNIRSQVMNRCKSLLPPPAAPKKNNIEDEGDLIEELSSVTKSMVPTGAMWYKIKHHVARTTVFGGFEGTGRANMYYVLDHLELLCKENTNGKP